MLAQTPLLGLTVTLGAYLAGGWPYRRVRLNALATAVLVPLIIATLS